MEKILTIEIYRSGGIYRATSPDEKNLQGIGKTKKEAIKNFLEIAKLYGSTEISSVKILFVKETANL
ncbi:MAG TPA: hypothetical protein DEP48_07600 [Persephonella sp.]|uniref:DUF1902 domain-containing protein n=1 Tax=Persephonella marina (strain DSM 14350 / EX-H1) TaxID=123214 RepID=C0QU09_PERMH|nr:MULTISPECIES: hypothetical protein [Persephonella]ACO03245.1 hypothetical protein PERMA_0382 [Persephonella marina EX-H1]HCB70209.1 hypothetical protein [Persephonella sp.]